MFASQTFEKSMLVFYFVILESYVFVVFPFRFSFFNEQANIIQLVCVEVYLYCARTFGFGKHEQILNGLFVSMSEK